MAGCCLAAAAVVLTGCAIADRMSGVSQARELQAKGEPAEATVLEIWDTGMTVNENPVVGFLLEVRPSEAPAYQVKTKALISRLDIPRIQPGLIVPVVYDPKDHARVSLALYKY